jgi:hypothetical protein
MNFTAESYVKLRNSIYKIDEILSENKDVILY